MIEKVEKFIDDNKLGIYFSKKYLDLVIFFFAVILGAYLNWGYKEIAAFLLVIYLILNPVKSEIIAKAALASLTFVPFLLVMRRSEKAEDFATIAYGFLVLTVVMAIYENLQEKQKSGIK